MKQAVKRALFAVAPKWATSFFSARARTTSHRAVEEWGGRRINDLLLERFGDRVRGGPFQGITLTPMTRAELLGPFLLGLYERELNDAWEVILRGTFPQIIDVGAKFGYYAVGLAQRFPESRVVAFDTDPWARKAMREMILANGVANVEIRGYCEPAWLAGNLAEGALILSDCEGFEGELLCSRTIPNLDAATLIVETHDAFVPGVAARLRERLGQTHDLTTVPPSHEDGVTDAFDLTGLDERERRLATQEVRPPQEWLVCWPRRGPNRSLRERAAAADPGHPSR